MEGSVKVIRTVAFKPSAKKGRKPRTRRNLNSSSKENDPLAMAMEFAGINKSFSAAKTMKEVKKSKGKKALGTVTVHIDGLVNFAPASFHGISTNAATEADVVQTTFLEDELLSFGLDPKLSASRILTSAAEDSGFDSSTRTEDPEAGVMSPPCQSPLPKMDVFDKISADEDLDYEALKHLLEIVHAPASDAAVNTIDEAGTTQGATATDNRAPDDATFNNVAPTMGGSDKGLPLTFPGTLFSPEKLIFPVISSANSHHIDAPLAAGSCTASANEEPPATAAAGGGAAVCLMEGGEVAEENPSMVLMAVIQDLQTSRNKSKKPRTNAQQESHKMEERRRRKRICDAKNRLHAVIEDKMVRQNKSELNVVMNAIVYLLQLQKSLSSDREEIEDLGKRIQATMQNLQELFPNRK